MAFYRQLIRLRHSEAALRHGKRRILQAEGRLLAYQLVLDPHEPGDAPGMIAVFNLSETEQFFELEGQQSQLALATSVDCRLTQNSLNQIFLPGLSAVLLRLHSMQ